VWHLPSSDLGDTGQVIGGWLAKDGHGNGDGCLQRVSDGLRRCAPSAPIYNDGTIGGGGSTNNITDTGVPGLYTLTETPVYAGPGRGFAVVGSLPRGASVKVTCQTASQSVVGNSAIWDMVGDGRFVPDYRVSTLFDGSFTPGLPICPTGTAPPSQAGVQSGGSWFLRTSNTTGNGNINFGYGNPRDIPIVGDWTHSGATHPGVYRPDNQTFYLRTTNTTGNADLPPFPFGNPGDIPLVGDWTGKGYDSVGVYRPDNQTFYLHNTNAPGNADIAPFSYGNPRDVPLVGHWAGGRADTVGVAR